MWSILFHRIYSYATYFYFYSIYLFNKGGQYFIKDKEQDKPQNKVVDLIECYVEKNKARFLKALDSPSLVLNKNIDLVFYIKKKFHMVIQDENNNLENEWKTRILFENTPRGNVIMYYNPFKLGFTYYADQYIPYNVLNAVAMKYVITYRCMDFFIDEVSLPDLKKSPLICLVQEDKKEEKSNLQKQKDLSNIDFKNKLRDGPFAKLKNYKITGSLNMKEERNEKRGKEDQKERNRFIYMGKTHNYSFLKIQLKKKDNLFSTTSPLIASLFENTSIQKQVFSYRNFKDNNKKVV